MTPPAPVLDQPHAYVLQGSGAYAVYGPPGSAYTPERERYGYGYVLRDPDCTRNWIWIGEGGDRSARAFPSRHTAALALIRARTGRVPEEARPVCAEPPALCDITPVDSLREGDRVHFPIKISQDPVHGYVVTKWGVLATLMKIEHGPEGWTVFKFRRADNGRVQEWMLVSAYRSIGVAREVVTVKDQILAALNEQVRYATGMFDVQPDPEKDIVRFGLGGGPAAGLCGGVGVHDSSGGFLMVLGRRHADGTSGGTLGSSHCDSPTEVGETLMELYRAHGPQD